MLVIMGMVSKNKTLPEGDFNFKCKIKYICTGCFNKKFPVTPGSILSQSQAFSTESNQSQSSIHVNIMVTGNFFIETPCIKSK